MLSKLFFRRDARRESAAVEQLRGLAERQRHFLFVQVDQAYREIELLPDGRIGRGASVQEQSWSVEARGGMPVLLIGGPARATCRLELEDTGVLRGHFLADKKQRVLLLPASSGVSFRPKISFYTTCMGRLHHLKLTLPANLRAAASYGNLEFVLLNYNSADGLDDWARQELEPHISSGLLHYYKTTRPQKYHASKSKNTAARLATGDILCNLDADNWLGHGFVEHLAALLDAPRTVARPHRNAGGVSGRLALWRSDFLALGGYDESLNGFGWDELDLFDRARADGFVERRYAKKFGLCLSHSHAERVQNIDQDKDITNERNRLRSLRNIRQGILVANAGKPWGNEPVVKNFGERIAA